MLASELIKRLQETIEKYGDLNVFYDGDLMDHDVDNVMYESEQPMTIGPPRPPCVVLNNWGG